MFRYALARARGFCVRRMRSGHSRASSNHVQNVLCLLTVGDMCEADDVLCWQHARAGWLYGCALTASTWHNNNNNNNNNNFTWHVHGVPRPERYISTRTSRSAAARLTPTYSRRSGSRPRRPTSEISTRFINSRSARPPTSAPSSRCYLDLPGTRCYRCGAACLDPSRGGFFFGFFLVWIAHCRVGAGCANKTTPKKDPCFD